MKSTTKENKTAKKTAKKTTTTKKTAVVLTPGNLNVVEEKEVLPEVKPNVVEAPKPSVTKKSPQGKMLFSNFLKLKSADFPHGVVVRVTDLPKPVNYSGRNLNEGFAKYSDYAVLSASIEDHLNVGYGVQKYIGVMCLSDDWRQQLNQTIWFGPTDEIELVGEDELMEKNLMSKVRDLRVKTLVRNAYYSGTIGSDPEVFVEDGRGECIPAFMFLPSKKNPDILAQAEKVYWDGFQGEFTVVSGNCLSWTLDSVQRGLKHVYSSAKKHFPDAKLSLKTVMDINPEMLQTVDYEYVEFGCMPSKNAYDIKAPLPPAREVPFRSSGGHIHFGCGKTTEEDAKPIVKMLDAILGVACVSLFAKIDDPRRRHLYGLPGEYRLPPHGIEYRPLSSAWLCHPLIANIVFDLGRKAFAFGKKNMSFAWNASEKETIDCMINSDVKAAREILMRNELIFKSLLANTYGENSPLINPIFNAFLNGVETIIASPEDFVKNWDLDGTWVNHCDGANKNARMAQVALVNGIKV